ncbi:hypothetical protein GGR50DRAFT_699085 [Xylaria sp. CBS 124048]|nr:hypothetical protein GGR50DRAFT_699085 [Xylaria sp. CBS 124048]
MSTQRGSRRTNRARAVAGQPADDGTTGPSGDVEAQLLEEGAPLREDDELDPDQDAGEGNPDGDAPALEGDNTGNAPPDPGFQPPTQGTGPDSGTLDLNEPGPNSETGQRTRRPDEVSQTGSDTNQLADIIRQQAELIRRQDERHMEMLALVTGSQERNHKEDHTKAPRYNCKRLAQDATASEIEDWIDAITQGNHQKPGRPEHIQIIWALGQASWETQTSWRAHCKSLGYENDTDAKLEDFWRFIRREDVDPELFSRTYRDQLEDIRQRNDESPRDFFARWQVLVRRLRTQCNFEDNDELAHHFYYRLTDPLKRSLIRLRVPLRNAVNVQTEAERQWSIWNPPKGGTKRGRTDSKSRASVSNVTTPTTVGGSDREGFPPALDVTGVTTSDTWHVLVRNPPPS